VKCLRLPPRSPNLNAFAERWVRSVQEECLSHRILFGERSLRKGLTQFQEHYHEERNYQGKNNVLLFRIPAPLAPGRRRVIRCRERDVAPVVAVRGNIDKGSWASQMPATAVAEAGPALMYVLHDIQQLDLNPAAAGFNIVISGHSHRPYFGRASFNEIGSLSIVR